MFSLSAFQTVLWLSVIGTQIALAAIVRIRKIEFHFPVLSFFVYFVNLQSISLFLVMWQHPRWTTEYSWAYYFLSFASCSILLLLNAEIYNKVFGPRFALPEGTPRRVATMLAVTVSACAALGYLLRSARGDVAIRLFNTADGVLLASSAAILWTLRIYSRRLGISWNQRVRGVASGLLLFLTVKSIAVFLSGIVPSQVAVSASAVGQIAYLVCAMRFCWHLSIEQEQVEPITPEIVAALSSQFSQIETAARRASGRTI